MKNDWATQISIIILLAIFAPALSAAGMATIPAGPFQMGCSTDDPSCDADEGPKGGTTVTVPKFQIDTHEVTVGEYMRCIKAGKCNRPKDHARNQYCNIGAKDRGKHPANCVDWQDAVDYCSYVKKRLPNEAEWEKAARATTTSRYPWVEKASCRFAILDDKVTTGSVKGEGDGCGEDRTWPVGSHAANSFKLYDMHGNAGEWTSVWYAKNGLEHYASGYLDGPKKGAQRVVRGGSWDEDPANLRSSFRNVKPPVSGKAIYGSIGFRCAR